MPAHRRPLGPASRASTDPRPFIRPQSLEWVPTGLGLNRLRVKRGRATAPRHADQAACYRLVPLVPEVGDRLPDVRLERSGDN